MAQSVEHIVHIDGVVGSSPTVTTEKYPPFTGGYFFVIAAWLLINDRRRCEHIDGGKPPMTSSGGNLIGGFLNRKGVISTVWSHDH